MRKDNEIVIEEPIPVRKRLSANDFSGSFIKEPAKKSIK